jgi:citrate lyase subunit beta/citryl-CoA lyase
MSFTNPRLHEPMRSKQFVPGSRPELFPKALKGEADALSFDLEDSVVEERKEEARRTVAEFLRCLQAEEKLIVVRVNGLASRHFSADVAAIVGRGLDVINLPKAESREDVLACAEAIARAEEAAGLEPQTGILANIESPKGLRLAHEIAAADPRVMGLQLGFVDLSQAFGIRLPNPQALNTIRLAVRAAAAEAGIAAFDTAFADVKNNEAFRADAEGACNLGFAGKSCIHPSQVPLANVVFSPSPEEVARAEALLAAAAEAKQQGLGAFVHDGKMVDVPVIARAQSVVRLAGKLGILAPQTSDARS